MPVVSVVHVDRRMGRDALKYRLFVTSSRAKARGRCARARRPLGSGCIQGETASNQAQIMAPQDPVGVRPVLCTRRDEGGRLTCSEFI